MAFIWSEVGAAKLFSKVSVPFCIPTILSTLAVIRVCVGCVCVGVCVCFSLNRCSKVCSCGFNLHFPETNNGEYLFIFFLAICLSYLVKCCFRFLESVNNFVLFCFF